MADEKLNRLVEELLEEVQELKSSFSYKLNNLGEHLKEARLREADQYRRADAAEAIACELRSQIASLESIINVLATGERG